MTEKDLSQFGLLEEFSITELEQRLELRHGRGNGDCTHQKAEGRSIPCYHDSGCYPNLRTVRTELKLG